jgi:hypothetical protein
MTLILMVLLIQPFVGLTFANTMCGVRNKNNTVCIIASTTTTPFCIGTRYMELPTSYCVENGDVGYWDREAKNIWDNTLGIPYNDECKKAVVSFLCIAGYPPCGKTEPMGMDYHFCLRSLLCAYGDKNAVKWCDKLRLSGHVNAFGTQNGFNPNPPDNKTVRWYAIVGLFGLVCLWTFFGKILYECIVHALGGEVIEWPWTAYALERPDPYSDLGDLNIYKETN